MNDLVYKIALAGLLHDIGKFAERAKMELEPGYENNNAGLYQRYNEQQKRHTHKHALFSAAFIERFADHLPGLDDQSAHRSGDSLINLAAMHHKPETALQWIIAQSDRLSSGFDRQIFEGDDGGGAIRDFRKTRLIPITEELLRGDDFYKTDSRDSYKYRYPLGKLSPETVFAHQRNNAVPDSNEKAIAEYAGLFEQFCEELKTIRHSSAKLWIDSFNALLERCTALIPAATVGKVIPDVSLYDHAKATAALAAALYQYHHNTGSMTEQAIKDNKPDKFTLITGDFYGIQSFIFSEGGSTNRSAAKLLRGRSFAVSLLSELAARSLCNALGLPATSILLNAAGKFTILAPNLPEVAQQISTTENELNDWLLQAYYGEVSIGFSSIQAAPADFEKGNFPGLWEKLGKAAERKKFRKLRLDQTGAVKGYLDSFDNRLSVCPFCGKRPADPKTENDAYLSGNVACLICRDHIHFGTHLIKSDTMAIVSAESQYKGKGLKSPLFGKYQIVFDLGAEAEAELEKGGNLLAHVSLIRGGKILKKGLGVRYVSGYVPTYTEEDQYDNRYLHGKKGDKNLELIEMIKNGEPKSFHHMAKAALNSRMDCDDKFSGVEALGILKADVDHLGKLFACGLPDERLNLSRLATFSRQMDSFFSIYIPWLLSTDSRFRNIYTVFAGGDDLFLIGPWNRIIQFAEKLKETFAHFCCENQAITISAGIIVSKPGVPVPNIAEQAEEALEEAKGNGRDSITLFGETAKWDVFAKQQNIRETIDAWQKNGSIGKGLLYQLNGLIAMAKKEKELVSSKKALELDDMSCLAWRSKLTYSATRNVGKNMGKTERQTAVEDVLAKLPGWLCEYDGKLKMALWQILYNQR